MPRDDSELQQLRKVTAGRYSVERELGRGGMGVVVLARDVALERPVAIKMLPPAIAANPGTRARFVREARTAAKLSHPNIVPIHSVEEHDDVVFFVMGFVDGETLSGRVRRAGPLAPSDAARLIQEMAWALAYAHSASVVHRDVKPDNVLIERATGRAMLTDFGIARVGDGSTLTGRGELIGTAQFVSPEQAAGDDVDGRSDIYSLGITAFFALSGRLPFEAPTLMGLLGAHMTRAPPPIRSVRAGLPGKLATAVDRCLAKNPAERFQSGKQLADAIADSRVTVADVPGPVRAFLAARTRAGTELLAYWAAVLYLGLPFAHVPAATLFPTMLALAALSVLVFVRSARRLRLAGFDEADVAAALAADALRRSEDTTLVKVDLVKAMGRIRLRVVAGTMVVGAAMLLLINLARANMSNPVVDFTLLGIGAFLFGATFSARAAEPGGGKAERPMLEAIGGFIMSRILRVAGMGVKAPPRTAVPVFEPTEVLLAREASDMLDALPTTFQPRLADAHRVLDKLQAHVARLRAREEELAATLAQAGPSPVAPGAGAAGAALAVRRTALNAEIDAARARVAAQRESAIAALENIRIQLLRLKTGLATPADFTADLEEAIRVERDLSAVTDAHAQLRLRSPGT